MKHKKIKYRQRYRKCPKCKRKLEEDNTLYVTQRYATEVTQWMSPVTGEVDDDVDTIASGYTDVWDFITNMVVPIGKPKILGCDRCIK